MSNSLFNLFTGSNMLPPQFNNIQNMVNRLNQFRNSFNGDPKQQAQQLLNSGQMSQSQYNQLAQLASQIQNMLTRR